MIEGATNTLKRCGYFYVEYGETIPYPESLTRDETIALLKKLDFEVMPAYSSDSEVGNLLFRNKNL